MPQSPPDSDLGFAGIGKRLSKRKSKPEPSDSVEQIDQQSSSTSPDHYSSSNLEGETPPRETVHKSDNSNASYAGLWFIIGLVIAGIVIATLLNDNKVPIKRIDNPAQRSKYPSTSSSIIGQQVPSIPKLLKYYYVDTLKANVRQEPNKNASIIMEVAFGQEVTELKREGEWIQVGIKSDSYKNEYEYTGWIHSSVLKKYDEMINNLRSKIETGRSQIIKYEIELKNISSNIDSLKTRINNYQLNLTQQEQEAKNLLNIDEFNYKLNIEAHNRLVKEYNKALLKYKTTLSKYEIIIDQDKLLVKQHNELIKR